MKRLLLCTLLGCAWGLSLNGAQQSAMVQDKGSTFATITPSIFYPLASTACALFGLIPNNSFPKRFQTPEEVRWLSLFIGCTVFIWYLRQISSNLSIHAAQSAQKTALQAEQQKDFDISIEQYKKLVTLLTAENDRLTKALEQRNLEATATPSATALSSSSLSSSSSSTFASTSAYTSDNNKSSKVQLPQPHRVTHE